MKRLIAASLVALGFAAATAEFGPRAFAAPAPAPGIHHSPAAGDQPVAHPDAWWDDRTAGLIGGIGGTVLGLLGGLTGSLGGCGKARRFVIALMVTSSICGVAAFVAGVVALAIGQPYAVWYPLLLGGGIAAVVFGSLLPVMRRRYAEAELRKMAAMDIAAEGKRPRSPH